MALDLVQIGSIPPLHQSTETMMACPRFYVEAAIKGNKLPGSLESARGTQIHKAMADYASWCAHKGVAMDLDAFDRFAEGVGPVAARILAGMRESYAVDFAHLLATELTLSLDENLNPTAIPAAIEGIVADSGEPATYQGTLDAISIFEEAARIDIDDAKSHPRPFPPDDTLQAKMYAVLAFLHFPWAQEVRFRLVFVRYKNVSRAVTFTRQDLPRLIEAMKSARARQKQHHAVYEADGEMQAIAGAHCNYCPLLANRQCPIAEYNPQMQLTMADRLNFNLWYSAFSRANNAAMKNYIDATGKAIVLRDFNGKAYVYAHEERETEVYPLFRFGAQGMEFVTPAYPVMPIVDLLIDYACDNQGDSEWMKNVTISSTSLRKYLKAKSRAFLDQAIEDTATKVTKTPLRVSKPLDAVPVEEDWDEDEEWEESEL